MIHVEGLTKHYGERVLFEDVSWHVKKKDRIGLSGPNGSGKTTLLRMLAGLEEPDEGSIRMASDTTIGYLPQDGIVHHGRTVYDEVVLAFEELLRLKEEQHRIEEKLSEATPRRRRRSRAACSSGTAEVTDRYKHLGGYEIDARVADVLKGLGFSLADQQRQTEEFSGGWQMRIALAKLLLARPEPAAPGRADQPSRPARAQLARGVHGRVPGLGRPRLPRPLLPRRHRQAHHPGRPAHPHRLPRQLLEVRGRARGAHGEPARGAPPAEGRDREADRLHQQVPLHGHQGAAGAEPHQDAGQGRAHRDPARAEEDPLQVPRRAQARAAWSWS